MDVANALRESGCRMLMDEGTVPALAGAATRELALDLNPLGQSPLAASLVEGRVRAALQGVPEFAIDRATGELVLRDCAG